MQAARVQEKLTRLRELLGEAVVSKPASMETAESRERRAFAWYAFNTETHYLTQSPAARAQREVNRIAGWYGWQGEVARALDRAGAASLDGLSIGQLQALRERMAKLEECVQEGLDPPDVPPAR